MRQILNSFALKFAEVLSKDCGEGYMLYLSTYAIKDLPDGVMSGSVDGVQVNGNVVWLDHLTLGKYIESSDVSHDDNGYIDKCALFNKELTYYYVVSEIKGGIYIDVRVSSLIHGKSNMNIANLFYRPEQDCWEIVARRWCRAASLNGFMGSAEECVRQIVESERQKGNPYDDMNVSYYQAAYLPTMRRQFMVDVTSDGISFNGYFGI